MFSSQPGLQEAKDEGIWLLSWDPDDTLHQERRRWRRKGKRRTTLYEGCAQGHEDDQTTSHGSCVGEMSLVNAIPLPHHEAGRDIIKKVGITILPDMAPASLEVLSALRS